MSEKPYYKEKRISNSSLKWFQQSPLYFKKLLDDEIQQEKIYWMEERSQIHAYILEPELFGTEYVFMDYDIPVNQQQKDFCNSLVHTKKGNKEEKLRNAYTSAYSSKSKSDDKILEEAKALETKYKSYLQFLRKTMFDDTVIIKQNKKELFDQCKECIVKHKSASQLMLNEEHLAFGNTDKLFIANEFHIDWIHESTQLECKSLIDRLIIDNENKRIILIDLKTCDSFTEFQERVLKYNYDRQFAFYWMAISWYLNSLGWTFEKFQEYNKESYVVAIKIKDLVEAKVLEIPAILLNSATEEINNIMSDLKWHYENDKWVYSREYYEGNGIEKLK
jgi:hypothetical protein